jgi:hypothetical protein
MVERFDLAESLKLFESDSAARTSYTPTVLKMHATP